MSREEWLIAWEALAQFVENCEDDDPKLPVAEGLLRRMDYAVAQDASALPTEQGATA